MLIIYKPESQEPQRFIFRPLEVNIMDAEDIEDVGGVRWATYDEFLVLLGRGKWSAIHAALWICLRGKQPELEFYDVRFNLTDVELLPEPSEVADVQQRIDSGVLSGEALEDAQAIVAAGKDVAGGLDTSSP